MVTSSQAYIILRIESSRAPLYIFKLFSHALSTIINVIHVYCCFGPRVFSLWCLVCVAVQVVVVLLSRRGLLRDRLICFICIGWSRLSLYKSYIWRNNTSNTCSHTCTVASQSDWWSPAHNTLIDIPLIRGHFFCILWNQITVHHNCVWSFNVV